MVHTGSSERQLLTAVLEREFHNTVRMIRAFPAGRADERTADCPHTARELAWAFVQRERLMHYVLLGRMGQTDAPAPRSLYEIVVAYKEAHLETFRALTRLTPAQWSETLRGPVGAGSWERGRRGELLWMTWKELVHLGSHFAHHLRAARQAEAAAAAHTAATAGAPGDLVGAALS